MVDRLAQRLTRLELRAGSTRWDQWRDLPIAEWPDEEVFDLLHAFTDGVASARLAFSRISDADIAELTQRIKAILHDRGATHDSGSSA